MATPGETSPTPQSVGSRSSSPSIRSGGGPPPLPPRVGTLHLTADSYIGGPYSRPSAQQTPSWTKQDPRTTSMSSLYPVESPTATGRRTLLLIYIHGFMGDETSFKSFPAHVHNLLTITVAETHVVHTKIYPRYRSRRPIEFARDDFSNWLCPHENDNTDVILIGHSMGGILAAEVALLYPYSPTSNEAFRHRILGVIAFDTPFLGMHPGIIGTGIASLFRPSPVTPPTPQGGDESMTPGVDNTTPLGSPLSQASSSIFGSVPDDPHFNPVFMNDKHLIERKGLQAAAYFINKHSDGLTKATKQYVMSHVEFGGCLADYPGLLRRYRRIRALEDIDESKDQKDEDGKTLRRIRFVNYYSASPGRVSQPKTPQSEDPPPAVEMDDMTLQSRESNERRTPSPVPRISVEEAPIESRTESEDGQSMTAMQDVEPMPYHSDDHASNAGDTENMSQTDEIIEPVETIFLEDAVNEDLLPTIPPLPTPPGAFDPSHYITSETLKAAQKEYKQSVKVYERALKDREKLIRNREKQIKKQEKTIAKGKAKEEKAAARAIAQLEKAEKQRTDMEERERRKRQATINPEVYDRQIEKDRLNQTEGWKKRKDRKFCTLPPKDADGLRDPTWVRVYMEGVDEVVAHTTLFLVSETYEKLVGDTAARIEGWVNEDRTRKLLLQERFHEHNGVV